MSRTLALIARMRGLAVAEARRTLAERRVLQDQAEAAESHATAQLVEEAAAAARMDTNDGAVEAFAAWLPEGRRAQIAARQALDHAQAATAQALTRLTLARAAEAAAEALIAAKAEEARREALKREQAVLDEIAMQRHPVVRRPHR